MKLNIKFLIAIIVIPLISLAESDDERIAKLEKEVQKLQEENAALVNKLDESPVIRKRPPIPIQQAHPETTNPQEQTFEFKKHTYKFIPKKESWLRAKKDAERMGGYLVVINSAEEEKYIENKIQEYLGASSEGVWIGLNDIDEEGKWCWVNGDKLTYTKWHEGEPNNNGGLPESCVVINKRNDYGWNDHAMDVEFRYLVEIDH